MKNHIYVTTRKTCSQALREAFVKEYDPESPYFDFAFYLLTTNFVDARTGCPILTKEVLQAFALDAAQRRTATLFLQEFRKYEPSFEWTDHNYAVGLARQGYCRFSSEVTAALKQDHNLLCSGAPRVVVKTGEVYNAEKRRLVYKEALESHSEVVFLMPSPEAKFIADYLNKLPLKDFIPLVDNVARAAEVATRLDNESARKQNLEMLAKIYEQPKPFYAPSHSQTTDRLFAAGSGFVNLSSPVRKALTVGMYECDLKSSQLAIIAKLWRVPEVIELLKQDRSVWEYLGAPEDKPLLKDCLYGLIYGMGVARLEREAPAGFMDRELVQLLLKCRAAKYREIERAGGATTITGRKLTVERQGRYTNVSSIMAQQAQAVELALLMPAIRLAQLRELSIVGWQHDGFTIKFPHDGVASVWLPRMCRVVKERADELGVQTELICTKNLE